MTKYIAIDGHGGSGKTYLSEQLAEELNATVFHLDKYGSDFVPFVGLPVLEKLVKESKADIVIYEGVGVFDNRFDSLNPYRIFVNTPQHLREERARGRDVPREDRTAEDWKLIYEIWTNAEKNYSMNEVLNKADIVVGSGDGKVDVQSLGKIIRDIK